MTVTTPPSTRPTRSLSPEASARIVALAVARRATVNLCHCDDGVCCGDPVRGAIVAGTDKSLTIRLEQDMPPIDSTVEITMVVEAREYRFTAPRAERVAGGPPCDVRVPRPTSVAIIDRRRAARRRLAEPAAVTLTGRAGGSPWTCTGALLNLSADGLACRLRERDTHPIAVGDTVAVSFAVGRQHEVFDLTGKVNNITPAGTTAHVVVGMEFMKNARRPELEAQLTAGLETVT
ncbi:MAG: PilZ domain-containing protein [Phycisphaerae bacterium]